MFRIQSPITTDNFHLERRVYWPDDFIRNMLGINPESLLEVLMLFYEGNH